MELLRFREIVKKLRYISAFNKFEPEKPRAERKVVISSSKISMRKNISYMIYENLYISPQFILVSFWKNNSQINSFVN